MESTRDSDPAAPCGRGDRNEPAVSDGLAMVSNWKPRPLWQRLLVALVLVAGASAFRLVFFGSLGESIPYLLYFPAVTLVGLYGGLLAGLLATGLSAGMVYFWINQGHLSPPEWLALAVFVISGVLISFICETMHRGLKREQLAREKAEAAAQELRREMAERKSAEESLRASEDRFHRAVVDAPFPILIHAEDGAILQASNSWCEITGYTRAELATISDWTERAYGESKPQVQAYIETLYSLGHRKYEGDYTIRIKSGGTRIWEFSSAPLGRLADGQRAVISMALDVTERRLAEQKLRESNDYLDNLFNYANAPIIVWDPQFKITRFNHAFESLTGRRGNDVIGKSLEILFPPAMVENSMSLIKKTTGGERWETVDISILHRDGLVRTVLWNSATIFDADGKTPVATIAQGHDITKRKEAEEILRQERDFSQSALDSLPGLFYLFDEQGLFLRVNKNFETVSGYSAAELSRMTPLDLFDGRDKRRIADAIQRARETGEVTVEAGFLSKDRTTTPYFFTGKRFQIDQKSCVMGMGVDITERKRAEVALNAWKQRLEMASTAGNVALWDWDIVSGILEWSGAIDLMLGCGKDKFPRTIEAWGQVLHPDDAARVAEALDRHQRGAAPYAIDYRVRRADGAYIWWHVIGVAERDAAGKAVRMTGSCADITERKRAEETIKRTLTDLERSNQELEHFAYIASHDLQEPLRMVASYTQLLEQHFGGQLDDKARKYIHYAVDGAMRMQTLINDLLAYSRVGRRAKPLEPADAHAVLGEAIRNLAAAIGETRAIITSDDLPTVTADPSQLVLLFQNLLSNAIKFRRAELPRVHVSAARCDGGWRFAFKDNGIGIEAQYAERVFVIFQRLHTKEEFPGTGIGLAICKRIVERHGGRIWFESQPGSGTTFFFTIPQ